VPVGERLRRIRLSRALSLRALAESSGLNINTLSLIENGRTSPSVSTLQQLAGCLQTPMTEFFRLDDGSLDVVHQTGDQRQRISLQVGTMEDLAMGMAHPGAEPLILTLRAGADSGEGPIVHTGFELVYCLEGRMEYTIQDKQYSLECGDSLYFEAHLPHSWRNAGEESARALLVLCPTDLHDSPRVRHRLT